MFINLTPKERAQRIREQAQVLAHWAEEVENGHLEMKVVSILMTNLIKVLQNLSQGQGEAR